MHSYLGLEEIIAATTDPYLQGRFSRLSAAPELKSAQDSLRDLKQLPPSRLKKYVTETLAHGVGFHTATLDARARERVEDGFREGYMRLLV